MPMRICMMFTGFFCVVGGVEVMPVCKVCVVGGGFRTARLMMSRRFAVMPCSMFVVLSSFGVMVNSCMCAHTRPSFLSTKMQEALRDYDDTRMTQT